jgi:FtsP/CotA-like multicopper oxidase with cupredoxin domain
MSIRQRKLLALTLGLAGLLAAGASHAKVCSSAPPCAPTVQKGEELCTIPEIPAKDGLLSTDFHVKLLDQCVPIDNNGTWTNVLTKLRTYEYKDPASGQTRSGFPGPVLRLHKPASPTAKGDRLEIKLFNDLEPDAHAGCNSACPATTVCPDKSKLPDPTLCPNNNDPLCCCWADVVQQEVGGLNCLHGDNITNLHFHGTHVSPQPPQDYALLELRPKPKAGATADPHAEHAEHAEGIVAYGEYQYKVDPLPWTQAEGTHWYHPHKHGSVSVQVANGMAGPLIIEGAFDAWLRDYYRPAPGSPTTLVEKIIAMQQIQKAPNLYTVPLKTPAILINGQVDPKITMEAGEVQRWRIVNATQQSSSQVTIEFPAKAEVRQIAMDGIQFGRENYKKQPVFDPNDPKAKAFQISPGNRADFLIKAPSAPGTYLLTEHIFANLGPMARKKIDQIENLEAKAIKAPEPPLLTLVVVAPKPQKKGLLKAPTPKGLPKVEEWPELPTYLRNITAEEVKGHEQHLLFSMSEPSTNPKQRFFINNKQFDPKCVDITIPLDTAEEWTVQNSSGPQHPFHIHTNPLQIRELGTVLNNTLTPFVKYDPPVWQDTVYLPAVNAKWEIATGPIADYAEAQKKCPDVCKAAKGTWKDNKNNWRSVSPTKAVCACNYTGNGYALFRSRYEEFTGQFVLHCHFLGHEDRGMMFAVQTVCPKDELKYGKARTDGKPECQGELITAAPRCAPTVGSLQPATSTLDSPIVVDAGDAGDFDN